MASGAYRLNIKLKVAAAVDENFQYSICIIFFHIAQIALPQTERKCERHRGYVIFAHQSSPSNARNC